MMAGVLIPAARAQFTADSQTNVISGVVSNRAGDYVVGSNTVHNLLRIENAGVLSNGFGYASFEGSVVVTGSGSVWNNRYPRCVGDASSDNSLFGFDPLSIVGQGEADVISTEMD
jgi:hypothetical protein